ncbi:MAG: redoxin domain-containing protein [Gammaproteobacteria bacterium]|nr:redoxin domain-containing protein [Gammaproteobacteria bacterium]
MRFRLLAIFCMVLISVSVVHADVSLQLFDKNSYQEMVADNKQESYLLVFWSLDCPPCMTELSMLGKLHKQYPSLNIMLVSTDSIDQAGEINKLMKTYGLDQLPQWVFSDEPVQYLRYSIDPQWYGELPRSYFHQAQQRKAVSGKLTQAQVVRWFGAG